MTISAAPTTDLAPDYYLNNFLFLMDWVVQRYTDLLHEDEHELLRAFRQLDRESQCLFVRLSSRKGPLFRADKLAYAEIDSIERAASCLITAGLLTDNATLSIAEVCGLQTKTELLERFKDELQPYRQERKELLVQRLTVLFPQLKTWSEWTDNRLGQVYKLETQALISRLLLLFFGNSRQDLTEFVLQDLGLYRYENYRIDPQHRIFKSRAEIEQYLQLVQLRDQLDTADTLEQLVAIVEALPPASVSSAIERRRARLCNQLAYKLEKCNEHALAFALYEQSHLPPARERCVRLLEKQGDLAAAWQHLSDILQQPINEHELQIARRMAPRLAKKIGQAMAKVTYLSPALTTVLTKALPTIEQRVQLSRQLDDSGSLLHVEEIVRLHLNTAAAPCFYVENLLLGGLFGLWLWPEMFRGVDGAFANPFQAAPLDLYQENFIANRPELAALWQLFDDNLHHQHILATWEEKFGIANHFVHWSFLRKDLIELALQCIPAKDLKAIFKRLLFDLKSNRSGLPDLIQFYPDTSTYRMIEVKGPGDRLQDNQQRWLEYFASHDIPAEVYYVSWQ
jgi:hypothetical protein